MMLSITKKTSTQHKGKHSENVGVIFGCPKKHSRLPQQGQCDGLIRMVLMTSPSSSRQREFSTYFPKYRISKVFSNFYHLNDVWIYITGPKAIWIHTLIVFWFLPKKPLTNFFWLPNPTDEMKFKPWKFSKSEEQTHSQGYARC